MALHQSTNALPNDFLRLSLNNNISMMTNPKSQVKKIPSERVSNLWKTLTLYDASQLNNEIPAPLTASTHGNCHSAFLVGPGYLCSEFAGLNKQFLHGPSAHGVSVKSIMKLDTAGTPGIEYAFLIGSAFGLDRTHIATAKPGVHPIVVPAILKCG